MPGTDSHADLVVTCPCCELGAGRLTNTDGITPDNGWHLYILECDECRELFIAAARVIFDCVSAKPDEMLELPGVYPGVKIKERGPLE